MYVWCLCVCACAARVAGARDSKEKDFVEIVKNNLKRNNEDYVDTTTEASPSTRHVGGRRALHGELDYYDFNSTSRIKSNLIELAHKNKSNRAPAAHTPTGRVDTEAAYANQKALQAKIEKIIKHYGNNEAMKQRNSTAKTNQTRNLANVKRTQVQTNKSRETFMRNKIIANAGNLLRHKADADSSQPMIEHGADEAGEERIGSKTSAADVPQLRNRYDGTDDEQKKYIWANTTYDTMEEEFQKFLIKENEEKKRNKKNNMADDRLLDMSPAKGGGIQLRRSQGRLCFRSVLIPEGPKYDSHGHAYRPALLRRRGRFLTTAASLVLPRCCNCCKKSALGCE